MLLAKATSTTLGLWDDVIIGRRDHEDGWAVLVPEFCLQPTVNEIPRWLLQQERSSLRSPLVYVNYESTFEVLQNGAASFHINSVKSTRCGRSLVVQCTVSLQHNQYHMYKFGWNYGDWGMQKAWLGRRRGPSGMDMEKGASPSPENNGFSLEMVHVSWWILCGTFWKSGWQFALASSLQILGIRPQNCNISESKRSLPPAKLGKKSPEYPNLAKCADIYRMLRPSL